MARAVSAMMAMMRVSSVRFMIVLCFRGLFVGKYRYFLGGGGRGAGFLWGFGVI